MSGGPVLPSNFSSPSASWSPSFGTGVNVLGTAPLDIKRVAVMRPVGATRNSIQYEDEVGNKAWLSALKPEELAVLTKKRKSP